VADIATSRAAIEAAGTRVAFVHLSGEEEADRWFSRYGVADLVRVSDPDKALYRQFGLEEATLRELAHPRVWGPWFRTAILRGHGVGAAGPSWRQLAGVFVIHAGRILSAIRHGNSAERPDYVAFVQRLGLGGTIRTQ
jgi:hypothetical protein